MACTSPLFTVRSMPWMISRLATVTCRSSICSVGPWPPARAGASLAAVAVIKRSPFANKYSRHHKKWPAAWPGRAELVNAFTISGAGSGTDGSGALNPGLAVCEDLFLPDRHLLLHPVDDVAAGLERLAPVGRGDGDDHAGLADRQPAHAVHDRRPLLRPALRHLVQDLAHLLLRHLRVGVVL